MEQQKMMEESFLKTHRGFISNLNSSLDVLRADISEAREMHRICTDEWCNATESYLDELAKMIYSISEPRWVTREDSDRIRQLRRRIHDLYAEFKGTAKAV